MYEYVEMLANGNVKERQQHQQVPTYSDPAWKAES